MPFMEFVIDCLKPGGEIFFATNETFYYIEAVSYMVEKWGLKLRQNKKVLQSDQSHLPYLKKIS